eukprot:gene28704-35614_t
MCINRLLASFFLFLTYLKYKLEGSEHVWLRTQRDLTADASMCALHIGASVKWRDFERSMGEKGEEDATVHANKRSGSVSEECEHRALAGFKQLIVGDGVEIPLTMIYAGDYDATLLRFLRARKLNLEKSFAMLKESIEYRKSEKFDTVLLNPLSTEKMDILRKYSLGAHSGTDRQ